MTTSLITRAISCFALLAWLALASVATEPAAKTELPELVVGDVYKVSIKEVTGETPVPFALVQQTDEWLVLGVCMSQENVYECNECYGTICELCNLLNPLETQFDAEQVPVLGKLLTKRSMSYQKLYFWVPRINIASMERVEEPVDLTYATFKGDAPSLDAKNSIAYRIGKEAKQVEAASVTVAIGDITFTKDGELTKIPLADVCSILQSIPFDYDNFKAEHDKKQAAK